MQDAFHPWAVSSALLLVAAALAAAAACWRRPRAGRSVPARFATGAWLVGNAALTAGTVSTLHVALGLAVGDAAADTPGEILGWIDFLAVGLGVGLLVWFAETETSRTLLLSGSALAAAASGASGPLLQALGLPLPARPLDAALLAAVLAPMLLSASSRTRLVSRLRAAAMHVAGDHVLVVDRRGRVLHASPEAHTRLGLAAPGRAAAGLPDALKQLLRDGQPRRGRLRTGSGHMLEAWTTPSPSRGALARARGVLIRDVTGSYRDERRLVKLAHYDSLTGLANRRLFLEILTRTLEDANRGSYRAALFYIDLDDFKTINDSLGHGAGDALLEVLADRLRSGLAPEELARFGLSPAAPTSVARLSGDEFAVVAPRVPDGQAASDVAGWILDLVARPLEVGPRTLKISASVGIAMCPEDGRDLDTLIRHADTALYTAKSRGRRRYAHYETSFDEKADRAARLERGLRQAIEHGELRIFYQPKVDAQSGSVVGLEALMRWKSADLGDVGPAEFIPIAEDRGLVTELGTWALREACRQLRAWKDAGLAIVPVAVNVSSHQFNEADLQCVVSDALKESGVQPHHLELELTESLLLGEGDHVQLVLRDLRSIGVRIALDDFGTGYSALTYLNRFNLDVLKMDRGLLRDIDTNPAALGIASAVVAMAHSLGLTVVAEGVDCEEQVDILRNMRCDQIQGFLYAPALPADEVVRFLARDGEAAPVCSPRGSSPWSLPRPATVPPEQDDAPALRQAQGATGGEAPVPRPEPEPAVADPGRVLVIDDGEEALGAVALRLSRLGIDIHYASAIDEAHLFVTQEGDGIRVIAAPPTIDLEALRGVQDHLAGLCDERRRVVVIGERPDDEVRTAIRDASVDWVLWAPFNDTELRCLLKSAMALSRQLADRREPRVPVDLTASIASGTRREVAVVSSLSPRGAFIETSDPLPMGTSLRVEMDMPHDHFRGFARVVHVRREDPTQPHEPSGMGVRFFGADRDTERILRKAVKELEARYLP